jgi:hypothetical protein
MPQVATKLERGLGLKHEQILQLTASNPRQALGINGKL